MPVTSPARSKDALVTTKTLPSVRRIITFIGSVGPSTQLVIFDRAIRFIAGTGAMTASSTKSSSIAIGMTNERRPAAPGPRVRRLSTPLEVTKSC
jgi:hypothetical protein